MQEPSALEEMAPAGQGCGVRAGQSLEKYKKTIVRLSRVGENAFPPTDPFAIADELMSWAVSKKALHPRHALGVPRVGQACIACRAWQAERLRGEVLVVAGARGVQAGAAERAPALAVFT